MSWDEITYGEHIADVYDTSLYGAASDTEETVAFLAGLADEIGATSLLELGSGTGRLLLPLAARGYDVAGVEISPKMVEVMRTKDGSDRAPVLVGDMTDFELGRRFGLVYIVYNSLHQVTQQERQLAALRAAARHLEPGGRLVVDAWVPYPLMNMPPRGLTTLSVHGDEVVLLPYRHDQAEQTMDSSVLVLGPQGIKAYPLRTRYIWPPELDLMAQLAGLERRERFADWDRRPFAGDDRHITVFAHAKPA